MIVNEYLLKCHKFYYQRVARLKEQVRELKNKLSDDEFKQHEVVKLAYRIRRADSEIIPQDPDRPEYRLRAELKKYRRYKQGLQRHRIIFCFSSQPRIIIYLYINDEEHLRKEGSKSVPYSEFKKYVKKGHFSHNPSDPKVQVWIENYPVEVER